MNQFLEETRYSLQRLTKDTSVHVVIGNEACDLDSAVAALVYAFYLYKENIHPGTIIVPLLDIYKHELRLSTDVVYLFKESNLPLESLIFRDDVDLKKINNSCKLSLTLVDHNTLSRAYSELKSRVIEVIDHHHKETDYDLSRCNVTIEKVGSCCTLVAEIIFCKKSAILDSQLALLLYGTILLDTICLNDKAQRVTTKDKIIIADLENLLGEVDRNVFYQKLLKAKLNISNFSMEELLNRDYKVISNNTMNISIASFVSLLEVVLKRPDAESGLKSFSLKTNSQIVVLMALQIDELTQEVRRQLAIFSEVQGYREQITDVLETVSLSGPTLHLQLLQSPLSSVILYNQGNIAASRKVILPLLNTFLRGDRSQTSPNNSCDGDSSSTNCQKDAINKGLVSENRSEEEELGNFDPLASESEDVLDSLTNSVSHLHVLGMGDPISHAGSSQSSSNQNSCPYTPQNSCTDGGLEMDPYARQILPSFNSREMMEKIESKRGKLRGYEGDGEGDNGFYPFTPKNSFVDNSFETYIKDVSSLDSGDFLLKVNEKVSTISMSDSSDAIGSISMEVPVIDYPQDIKSLKNGDAHSANMKEECSGVENQSDENGGGSNLPRNEPCPSSQHYKGPDDRDGFQSCPEAVSLSDKLEKSEEKMDISDTSGSSEKASPLSNDTEIQVTTTTTTTDILTNTLQTTDNFTTNAAAAVAAAVVTDPNNTTSTALFNDLPLNERKRDIQSDSTTPNNVRTSSTASVGSLTGDEVDLELPSNYQTETVDFPDSPGQLKLMHQSTHEVQQGTSLDEPLAEDEVDTEQPDDDVFRAVLSPSSEGAKLKKEKTVISASNCLANRQRFYSEPEILRQSTSSTSSYSSFKESSGNEFLEDMLLGNSCEEPSNPSNDRLASNDSSSVLDYHCQMGTVSYASTPYATDVRQKLDSVVWSSVSKLEEEPSAICSAETTSERVSSPKVSVDFSTLAKINSSFDRVKIKDIFAMSNRLSDVLTYQEIEEVLNHGEAYESYLSDEIFEALQLIKMEMDEEFTNNSLTDLENLRQSKKKRISLNKGALDQSIADHFESELHISAVFEGNRSLRRTAKTPKPLPNFQEFEHGNWKRTLVEVSRGSTEAFFEESLGDSPFKNRRKKIIAPVSLSLLDISDSPERNLMKELTTNVSEMIISNQQNCENTKESEKPKIITDDDDDDAIISRSSECHCSESSSPERPNTLSTSGKKKRKIKVNPDILNLADDMDDKSLSSLSNESEGEDIMSPLDDIATPDDIETPDDLEDSTYSPSEQIEEVSAAEERDDERRWRTCVISGLQRKIDMKVIEPYKKVLSHGGYYGPKRSAIIVFCACYLPDHSRKDYDYVMDNLFLYVLTTLDQLVAEDYMLVYLHGAMDRNNMPTFGWLKRCYQMIDRRLRKNLKGLYLVHPTFWLKTIVIMTRPFISSKFSRKLQFVNSLQELEELVPIDQMSIPDRVKQLEFEIMIKEKKKNLKTQK